MPLWLAIALPVVVAAFLAWYIIRGRRRGARVAADPTDPISQWDALSHGEDPTADASDGT